MARRKAQSGSNPEMNSEPNLKGTLYSVMGVGAVIAVMWFAVYAIYLAR